MSSPDHPETDGQMERANRVLEVILRDYVHSFSSWSEFLSMVEFTINDSVHASTQHTPFFANGLRLPRLPTLLECDSCIRGEGLARAKIGLALTHHVSTLPSSRMMTMSIRSTSKKTISIIAMTLVLSLMKMLVFSASPTTIPARKMTPSLMTRKRKGLFAVRTRRTEQNNVSSAEGFLLALEAVVRFVQDSIAHAVDRQNGTLTRMEEQMFFHVLKAI